MSQVGDILVQEPNVSSSAEMVETEPNKALLVNEYVEEEEECEEIECESNPASFSSDHGQNLEALVREEIQGTQVSTDDARVIDEVFICTNIDSGQRGAVMKLLEWECDLGIGAKVNYVLDEEEGKIPNSAKEKAYDSEPDNPAKFVQAHLHTTVRKSQ